MLPDVPAPMRAADAVKQMSTDFLIGCEQWSLDCSAVGLHTAGCCLPGLFKCSPLLHDKIDEPGISSFDHDNEIVSVLYP